MTIYQAMQLNVKNLKAAISDAPTKKDKHRYIAAMILRNIFCLAFCIIFITFFTTLFGNENSSVGIIGLLAVLSLRFTDLDFNIKQSTLALIASFVICAIAPHLANIVPLGFGLLINFSALLLILILTSHQVSYANHFTFILGYILLWGNDVSENSYTLRIIAMMVAAIFTALVYYHCHYQQTMKLNFKDILKDFFSPSKRTFWYLKISSAIALVIFLGEMLNFSRTMWIAFACMSIINIDHEQIIYKFKHRALFVVVGSIIFGILFTIVPKEYLGLAGILGGIMVGFRGSYHWQTVFNCFGALAITIDLFGFLNAIIIRIVANIAGSIFSFVYHHLFEKIIQLLINENLMFDNNL